MSCIVSISAQITHNSQGITVANYILLSYLGNSLFLLFDMVSKSTNLQHQSYDYHCNTIIIIIIIITATTSIHMCVRPLTGPILSVFHFLFRSFCFLFLAFSSIFSIIKPSTRIHIHTRYKCTNLNEMEIHTRATEIQTRYKRKHDLIVLLFTENIILDIWKYWDIRKDNGMKAFIYIYIY